LCVHTVHEVGHMEIKKAKTADLESKRTMWFLLGVVLVLSIIFVSLEYTSHDGDEDFDIDVFDDLNRDVELVSIKKRQEDDFIPLMAPKPKRKESPTKINVVDNPVPTHENVQLPESTIEQEGADNSCGGIADEDDEQAQTFSLVGMDNKDNPLNFRVVEDLPQFPGGAVELMKWLTKNLRYPSTAQRQKAQGKVVVQFIINTDGAVSNLKVVKSLNADCDREALRVMRMMPRWKPGVKNDKPCRTMVCIPIIFKL